MNERKGIITFGGDPVTLIGEETKVGSKAPEFKALKNDLSEFSLDEVKGKVVIISSVPSIDTPVCELQTKRFNEEAAKLDDAVVLTLSCDLPFAQSRFCAADGIDKVIVLSDHRDLDFGTKYGLVIKELRLLARAITIIDKDGTIKYQEIVSEVTNHPDYDKALEEAKKLI